MKRSSVASVLVVMSLLLSAPANASGGDFREWNIFKFFYSLIYNYRNQDKHETADCTGTYSAFSRDCRNDEQPQTEISVPEIDAAGMPLALTLLGGLIAIRRERRKPL